MSVEPPNFDNLLNFRDVAVNINGYLHRQVLCPGQLYRSARPDSASVLDRQKLRQEYGIRTIIDLRSKTEHIEAAKKYANKVKAAQSSVLPVSDKSIIRALKVPGIDYAEININGKGFERHLIWQLSYGNLAWLIAYMSLGYRMQGVGIIGKNVLQPRGLIGLGKDTLKHSGPEIKEVFNVLANPKSYPILVHCTQGKDRTGLIVMLALFLCDIDIEAVSRDYVLSEVELQPELEERMKEITSIGLDESFAGCPKEFVPEVAAFVRDEYGTTEQYLTSIGVTKDQLKRVQNQLRI